MVGILDYARMRARHGVKHALRCQVDEVARLHEPTDVHMQERVVDSVVIGRYAQTVFADKIK